MALLYFLLLNIVSFTMMGIDKKRAIKGKWRISEKSLMLVAFIGGAFGMLVASRLFHHKTKKLLFKIGLPTFFIIHLALVIIYIVD
ncbi:MULTISPECIES: DUF1294 domain-containing protein [Bacillaceae]|uniref:DUF1294 domain-containing protein n=1 Tax=Evansella alkalicola TaxID=745819 RepID=A0ABS6JRI8_9BACI|nr:MULTISPECIES: DUF1294 domain-containing protein [Bacillaceae]MBU9721172.1 DUF1294 domain-containing protein [Bacillus alkalicola]